MDSDSPISRVERTFWTVWYYISGAVSRFLRPEPANVTTSDPNSIQESEHAIDASRGGVGEEQPLATASQLNSSRSLVAWELCSTDINLGPDGENVQYKKSEEGEGTREEQVAQVGHGDAELLVTNEDKQEENRAQQFNVVGREEMSENCVCDAMTDDMEESGRKDDAQEAELALTLKTKDTVVKLCRVSLEEEDNIHIEEAKVQRKEADTVVMHEEVENLDGVPQLVSDEGAKRVEDHLSVCEELSDDDSYVKDFTSLNVKSHVFNNKSVTMSEGQLIVVEQEHVTAHRNESDERDQTVVIEEADVSEAANIQARDEDNMETEDSQELVTCSKDVQNAKAELDVGEDTGVQTKPRETDDDKTESHREMIDEESDVTTMHISERFLDVERLEEERLSEVSNKGSYMTIACTTTSVTVKLEGETGQEMSGFKNIPQGICEGQVVVPQELNFPTYEETQEGVPEHNNESWPDGNTTQRILEGDDKEIQGSQLPEELECLQNSGCSTNADYSPLREHMEEEQEGTQDIKNSINPGVRQETEKQLVEAVIQESGSLFEEEEGDLLVDSMRTGIEHSGKEYFSDETDEVTQETEAETEELLVEFEIDEGLCDSPVDNAAARDSSETTGAVTAEDIFGFTDETEAQKTTETSFLQQSLGPINSEQNSNMTASLLEDIAESGFCKPSDKTVPTLLEDVQMLDAGIDIEEAGHGVEKAGGFALQSKNEMEILHLGESEFPLQVESLEVENQQSDKAHETSNEEMFTEPEAADESTTAEPKDPTWISTEKVAKHVAESEWSCAEETVPSISGRLGVINDEILDLWLQADLSEDTSGIKQHEGLDPGQQMEPTKEEQDEVSSVQTKTVKKQKSNSGESELVSDAEMSSSTAESGFLDQSLSDWGTQNSETQLLKSTSAGSFQGIYDMLTNMSESVDISELSTQHPDTESQAISMEEETETEQSHLKQEEFYPIVSLKLQEKSEQERAESVETETGSQKESDAEVTAWKDTEDAVVKSLTGMSVLLKAEKTNAVPYSLDEIKHTASESIRSGSEPSLEEEIVYTESGSQGDTCSESGRKLPSLDEPDPVWSEDIAESLAGLNRDEVAEEPKSDQMEVETSVLDCTAQRWRIAVKNPRVRPPRDPRSLLHMPSVDPTPLPHLSAKIPAGVPLGGLGIGIKLPGLGSGFPVLKKTPHVVREETSLDNLSQETKSEEKSDTPKEDEAQHKPKWMPPRHPGFGNPLMSELKTKLKKTTK